MPVLPPDMRSPALLPCLAIILLVAAITSLAIGAVPIDSARLLAAATGHGDRITTAILFDLRLPRAVLGIAIGGMLGLAGAVLQGYLRNPPRRWERSARSISACRNCMRSRCRFWRS